ncbi:GntR family transcriptional regulator [Vallitalea pronyensis]|uniref:GntR family transcriptional regulator n=1 Tax=Vallitalea pronyensis TaxID=1348613 RepID=A0A8J8MLI4_9FIRM|nr:GntR family transcriptional regulator [Vallitalea pronyensis]QUI23731.1 GntR family transcriptional regulator [Vallitalea pronyensis]
MNIIISNASSDPIYLQITNQIKKYIITGDLVESEPLPSIRKLAKELQISVITTKRAYEELEKEGLVESVRGKGFFVALRNKELLREKKMQLIEDHLSKIIDESKMLGISLEEFIEIITLLYE